MKYVKKPIVVEAWKTGSDEYMPDWLKDAFDREEICCRLDENDNIIMYIIDTLEGTMTCGVGDYIIRGVHGEIYPCKCDIFKESYVRLK